MPRWKALPEDLDPQIKEFTSQLRRLVDRSGLGIAALADRTGYSKTSWERYLGGRLLAPKGAVVALAEVTGTSPVHLTTMWELAERAWSRAEARHDRTMEAIRISQARAALGEFGAAEADGAPSARKGGSTTVTPGIAGPGGVSPTIPAQPTAPDADARENAERGTGTGTDLPSPAGPGTAREGAGGSAPAGTNSWGVAGREAAGGGLREGAGRGPGAGDAVRGATGPADGDSSGGNSWRLAGYRGPSPASARPGTRPPVRPEGPAWTPDPPSPYAGQPAAPQSRAAAKGSAGRQRLTMFLAGLVGVLVVIAAVFFFTHRDGDESGGAAKSPSPSASTRASLPPGVKCAGSACNGKDAEAMGCSGDVVTTAKSATVGTTTVEVRYSKICGTAWGRVTGGAQGDKVQVSAGKVRQTGDITAAGDAIAYTPMVAVKDAAEAKACATLASGRTGCTR
ncbi:DUF2690 domain-containing protein [Streptomyces sp. NPDC006314]|uniref:XRE family transcriptional regulator n=1 Tax=Streptomyces sp. NPDC006314 TaxID=3154475 RepID=UPI0033B3C550